MRYKFHKRGETRVIKKFLFLPKIINEELRWLEFATIQQEYLVNWNDIRWIDKKEVEE